MSVLKSFSHTKKAGYHELGIFTQDARWLFLKEPTIAEMAQAQARAQNSTNQLQWEQSIWLTIICVYEGKEVDDPSPKEGENPQKIITYSRAFNDADYKDIVSRLATDEFNGLLQAVSDTAIVLVNQVFSKSLPKAEKGVGGKITKKP